MVCKQYIAFDDFATEQEIEAENDRIKSVKAHIARRKFGVIKKN